MVKAAEETTGEDPSAWAVDMKLGKKRWVY